MTKQEQKDAINIEAVNARAKEEQTPMTKIPSVEDTSRHFCNGFALQLKPSNAVMETLCCLTQKTTIMDLRDYASTSPQDNQQQKQITKLLTIL